VVGATFPLEQAADAHRALEAGRVTGKAVLVMP
jgi:NADPH:quinone reductase-like Zn-dependent oxidoreductase